jgi:N-acetylglutamate synthase-like GNAT family acetyltransferase
MSRSRIEDSDREEVAEFVERHWRSRIVMSAGRAFYPHKEEGFIERVDGKIVGLLTYHMGEDGMEILTLNSTLEGHGIGSSLMHNAIEAAREDNCDRVWLTTTNDAVRVIGFYQRLGFRMIQINLGAVDEARKIKPQIPEVGERGVPIHDEVVLELRLKPYIEQ